MLTAKLNKKGYLKTWNRQYNQGMKPILIATLCLCAPAWAQTKVDIRQTKAPSAPATTVLVFQGGRATLAVLGQGIALDTTTTPPTLRIEAPAAPQPVELRLSKTGSTWPVGRSCSRLVVWRNGVRQLAGDDYSITAGAVSFRSGATDNTDPSTADDAIVAECWQ